MEITIPRNDFHGETAINRSRSCRNCHGNRGKMAPPVRFDQVALERLLDRRFGRTVLLTDRPDPTAEQVVAGYDGPQRARGLFIPSVLAYDTTNFYGTAREGADGRNS
jgi:hypothetical protein